METPLIKSPTLKKRWDLEEVYLKLETCQATGSFKDRAMLSMCAHLKEKNPGKKVIVVCSSGGNAGLAAAFACQQLNLAVHIFVPTPTRQVMLDRIAAFNPEAKVHKVGANLDEAGAAARQKIIEINNGSDGTVAEYAPPFDNEYIFKGNSTIVDELREQLKSKDLSAKIDAIVCSVGGGGLAAGILEGLAAEARDKNVKLICVETNGTASFRLAWGEGGEKFLPREPVPMLDEIKSIAHSLGAKGVSAAFLDRAHHHGNVLSDLVSDQQSLAGVKLLLDDHRLFVEPACGACLASVENLVRSGQLNKSSRVLIIVCGGSCIDLDIYKDMKILSR